MQNLPIHFVSTIPRSGSTLFMNLLGQNPNHHVTPTNDLLDMIVTARNHWMNCISFKAQGLKNVKPRVISMMRGMIRGFFEKEFDAGKTVFDKSRGWFAHIELMEEVLQQKVKILTTVRDIRAVVASFEKLHRQSALTKHTTNGDAFFDCQTVEGRARQILHKSSVLGLAINRLRDVRDRGLADRLIIIPYQRLLTSTQAVMDNVHLALKLPSFRYDPDNVEQITQEDDDVHGMELHTIRSKIEAPKTEPWIGVLPDRVIRWLEIEYSDINQLATM